MARKSETNFRINTVVPALKLLKHTYFMSIQQVAICADPDILLCINGRFVALELKSDDESIIRPLQTYKLEQIIKAGGVAFRADRSNWAEVHEELLKLSEGNRKWEKETVSALLKTSKKNQ
jgi:hypothetical protein